jgi:small subunit ribosomal protein S17
MPKKKTEDEIVDTPAEATDAAEAAPADDKPKRARKAKSDDAPAADEGASVLGAVADAASGVLETVATTIGRTAADVVNVVTGPAGTPAARTHKRAERIGIVASDKMEKTVTVRVDRVVKHPVYRKYVKRRKKFMAHDETGAKIGDKVRIVETRPLSARKRWRVVEIIQRAEL